MKAYLAAALIAAPIAASAQSTSIPDPELKGYFDNCVRTCDRTRSFAFCAERCGCMTHEISRHWDMQTYRERIARLRADAADREVRGQMGRLAEACATRAGEQP